MEPAGYTGWRWLPGSPFGDRAAWERDYVTGYRGYTVHRVEAAAGARVLADLVAYGPGRDGAGVGRPRRMGAAIVRTERTCYIANEPFELLGGVLQAHLNVEDVRRRHNPVHWGDTIALFLRQLLLELGLEDLWETRLRSFGSHAGAFSYRQDIHGHQEYSFLDYEVRNLVPATFCIEDPALSTHTTPEQARLWAEKAAGIDIIERGLHNDSVAAGPTAASRWPSAARASTTTWPAPSSAWAFPSTPAGATAAGTCTPRPWTPWTISTPTMPPSWACAPSPSTTWWSTASATPT